VQGVWGRHPVPQWGDWGVSPKQGFATNDYFSLKSVTLYLNLRNLEPAKIRINTAYSAVMVNYNPLQSLPSSEELPDSDDTPVDHELQSIVPTLLRVILNWLWVAVSESGCTGITLKVLDFPRLTRWHSRSSKEHSG